MSHRGKAGDFAFVPHAAEAERLGGRGIHLAEAVLLGRHQNGLLAAIQRRERTIGEMTMAVVHGIAAAVGGDEQRIVPWAVEQCGQRVGFVVIIKVNVRVAAKPAIFLHARGVEEGVDVGGLVPHQIPRNPSARLAPDMGAILLFQPLCRAEAAKVTARKLAAAIAHDVHISPCRAGDREYLVDRCIRVLSAVAFLAREAFQRDRCLQRVIRENRGAAVMRAGMDTENELGHGKRRRFTNYPGRLRPSGAQ